MSVVSDVESLGMMREDGVRLSVGCNHLNYIDDDDCCITDLFKPPEHKVVPCITITVTDDSENANADWRRFFQVYNQLKDLMECSSEYDESVCDLLSALTSASGLKKVDLFLRFMTVDGASRVLDLIQMNPSLSELAFLAVERPETSKANFKKDYRNEFSSVHRTSESEEDSDSDRSNDFRSQSARQMSGDSDEDSMSSSPLSDCSHGINDSDQLDNVERILCSDIRMWKTLSGKCSLILKCNDSSPSTQSLLSRIELTLSENSGETSSDWKTFIRAYNQCKGLSIRSPAFDESVDALLLSLHSVSGLKKVQLTTHSLTEKWVPKILSLCHTCPSLHDVCLQVQNDKRYSVLNVCSSLIVTKNITDSTCTVDIRLARDSMISPSFISFTSPCSEIPKLDGQELFETLDLLKGLEESCSEHEELVGDLMSSLLSVSGLRRVGLQISSLTENWVRRILFLAGVCPSLQEIRYDCIESGGLLLEDVVRILQSSQMDSDCRIIITGMKCSETMDGRTEIMIDTSRSSSACDEKVKVTFCRDSLTRLFTIDNIETENHNDDDFEDPDEEDFIVL